MQRKSEEQLYKENIQLQKSLMAKKNLAQKLGINVDIGNVNDALNIAINNNFDGYTEKDFWEILQHDVLKVLKPLGLQAENIDRIKTSRELLRKEIYLSFMHFIHDIYNICIKEYITHVQRYDICDEPILNDLNRNLHCYTSQPYSNAENSEEINNRDLYVDNLWFDRIIYVAEHIKIFLQQDYLTKETLQLIKTKINVFINNLSFGIIYTTYGFKDEANFRLRNNLQAMDHLLITCKQRVDHHIEADYQQWKCNLQQEKKFAELKKIVNQAGGSCIGRVIQQEDKVRKYFVENIMFAEPL